MQKKKVVLLVAIVLFIAIALVLYFALTSGTQGEKSVKVSVTIDGQTTEISAKTDAVHLDELLAELQAKKKLTVVFEDGAYGKYIVAMNERTANPANEYFAIYVNGDYGAFGVSEQTVTDGDAFEFKLEKFA